MTQDPEVSRRQQDERGQRDDEYREGIAQLLPRAYRVFFALRAEGGNLLAQEQNGQERARGARAHGDDHGRPQIRVPARRPQQHQATEQQDPHDQAGALAPRRQAAEQGGHADVVEPPERLGDDLLHHRDRHPARRQPDNRYEGLGVKEVLAYEVADDEVVREAGDDGPRDAERERRPDRPPRATRLIERHALGDEPQHRLGQSQRPDYRADRDYAKHQEVRAEILLREHVPQQAVCDDADRGSPDLPTEGPRAAGEQAAPQHRTAEVTGHGGSHCVPPP